MKVIAVSLIGSILLSLTIALILHSFYSLIYGLNENVLLEDSFLNKNRMTMVQYDAPNLFLHRQPVAIAPLVLKLTLPDYDIELVDETEEEVGEDYDYDYDYDYHDPIEQEQGEYISNDTEYHLKDSNLDTYADEINKHNIQERQSTLGDYDEEDAVDNYYAFDDDFYRNDAVLDCKGKVGPSFLSFGDEDYDNIIETEESSLSPSCRRTSQHRLNFQSCNTFHEISMIESGAHYVG